MAFILLLSCLARSTFEFKSTVNLKGFGLSGNSPRLSGDVVSSQRTATQFSTGATPLFSPRPFSAALPTQSQMRPRLLCVLLSASSTPLLSLLCLGLLQLHLGFLFLPESALATVCICFSHLLVLSRSPSRWCQLFTVPRH